jgi:hypothetical protein
MSSNVKGLLFSVAGLAMMSAASTALANDGTPPWIHELVQDGQDVRITLAVVSDGEPGMGESYTLTRNGSWIPVRMAPTPATSTATETVLLSASTGMNLGGVTR